MYRSQLYCKHCIPYCYCKLKKKIVDGKKIKIKINKYIGTLKKKKKKKEIKVSYCFVAVYATARELYIYLQDCRILHGFDYYKLYFKNHHKETGSL